MKIYIIAVAFILFYSCDVLADFDDNKTIIETIALPFRFDNLYGGIEASSVRIYNGDGNRVFVPIVLYRIDKSNYFLTFYLYKNFTSGNYSVVFESVKTINNSVLISSNFTYNHSIVKTNSSLRIDPNVLFLEETNDPFDVLVSSYDNYGRIVDVNISIIPNTGILGENVIIASIDSKKLESLSIHNLEVIVRNIKTHYIGKIILNIPEKIYEVLVYSNSPVIAERNLSFSKNLIFINDKKYINLSLGYGETIDGSGGKIFIKNDGGLRIDRINIGLTGNLAEVMTLENVTISLLDAGAETFFFVYVNKNLDTKIGEYTGEIKVTYDDGEINLPAYVSVPQRPESVNITEGKNITQEDKNQTLEPLIDGKKDNAPLLVLGLVVIVISVFTLIFLRKQKKKENVSDTTKKLDEIIEKYQGK